MYPSKMKDEELLLLFAQKVVENVRMLFNAQGDFRICDCDTMREQTSLKEEILRRMK